MSAGERGLTREPPLRRALGGIGRTFESRRATWLGPDVIGPGLVWSPAGRTWNHWRAGRHDVIAGGRQTCDRIGGRWCRRARGNAAARVVSLTRARDGSSVLRGFPLNQSEGVRASVPNPSSPLVLKCGGRIGPGQLSFGVLGRGSATDLGLVFLAREIPLIVFVLAGLRRAGADRGGAPGRMAARCHRRGADRRRRRAGVLATGVDGIHPGARAHGAAPPGERPEQPVVELCGDHRRRRRGGARRGRRGRLGARRRCGQLRRRRAPLRNARQPSPRSASGDVSAAGRVRAPSSPPSKSSARSSRTPSAAAPARGPRS